ncbi:hypothetical protein ACFOW4_23720 [Micromonospora sp. GCM10011542]|uniref:hypothetical protein n=1 Tax=Micromonospora sp. GCM10011542 TaxID=3317337 RepID=UPI0036191521
MPTDQPTVPADPLPRWRRLAPVLALLVWSDRVGWGQRHVLAAGTASLVSAAGFAYMVPPYAAATPVESLVGDVAVTVVTFALVGGAWWRLRRTSLAVHIAAK